MFMAKLTDLPTKDKDERRRQGRPNFVHIRYADDFVVLCNGRKQDAEAMKEKLHCFLSDRLKLALSRDKTRITHIDDGFKFLGYEVRRCVTGRDRKHPKFLIPQEAKMKLRQTIQRITAYSSVKHSVHAKVHALNRHLRGWANYYRYANNAAPVFAKLDSYAFWQLAHWLGRKHRCSMPSVMKQYKRSATSVITLGTDRSAVIRMGKVQWRSLQARCFTNPYELPQAHLVREVLYGVEYSWFGDERRPGMADLRELVLRRDRWTCQACGQPVTVEDAQVDHVRPVRRFKRPIDANVYGNLQTLCGVCHKAKTKSDRQMESRMR
jgi:5-methylcytosine-specific restriction endonuclease McrA